METEKTTRWPPLDRARDPFPAELRRMEQHKTKQTGRKRSTTQADTKHGHDDDLHAGHGRRCGVRHMGREVGRNPKASRQKALRRR